MATTLQQAIEYLNQSYENAGFAAAGSNVITAQNLEETIQALPLSNKNKIMECLNLILEQRTYRGIFDAEKNPFRRFYYDMMENGFGRLDIYLLFIDGMEPLWRTNATNQQIYEDLVSRKEEKIAKRYHTASDGHRVDATIDEKEYAKVFTATAFPRFIDMKLANLSASMEKWLQARVIAEFKKMNDAGDSVFNTGHNLNTEDGIAAFIETVNTIGNATLNITDAYNKDGIETVVDSKEDLLLVVKPSLWERIKVRFNAGVFNLDEAKIPYTVVMAPEKADFGTYGGEEVLAMLVDRRAVFAGISTWRLTSRFVENMLYYNYWLQMEGLFGYNTFFTCVALTGTLSSFGDAVFTWEDSASDDSVITVNGVRVNDGVVTPVSAGDIINISLATASGADAFIVHKSGEMEQRELANGNAITVPATAYAVKIVVHE